MDSDQARIERIFGVFAGVFPVFEFDQTGLEIYQKNRLEQSLL